MTGAAAHASLKTLLNDREFDAARMWLAQETSVAIAEEFSRLSASDMAASFRLLEKDKALKVFEFVDPPVQADLLEGLREEDTSEMFRSLAPDDQAELLDEMPAKVASRMLEGLPKSRRDVVNDLLGFPAESAGRLMVPTPTVLSPRVTREQALEKIQRNAAKIAQKGERGASHSDIAVIPVTDDTRKLLGTVALSALVTAPEGTLISDLMHEEKHHVSASVDQEIAARLMQESDMLALPVVDEEDRILGLITVDDAMEVLEFEATEDAYRSGGSEPLKEPYLTATVMTLARKRGVWLVILILAAFLTINVMEMFEATLEAVVVLSVFVPMIIGTGGNAGSQAASSVVRALAVDEVRPGDVARVIWREVRVGFLLGTFLGALIFPVIFLLYDGAVASTISLTIIGICTWACMVGGVLPLVGRKLGVDPAVFSTPVVSTLVDATGLLIYFTVAGTIMADQIAAATGG